MRFQLNTPFYVVIVLGRFVNGWRLVFTFQSYTRRRILWPILLFPLHFESWRRNINLTLLRDLLECFLPHNFLSMQKNHWLLIESCPLIVLNALLCKGVLVINENQVRACYQKKKENPNANENILYDWRNKSWAVRRKLYIPFSCAAVTSWCKLLEHSLPPEDPAAS